MTFEVRVSSYYVVDLGDHEDPPSGFERRDKWPPGRHALQYKMVTLEDLGADELHTEFEGALHSQLEFFETNPDVGRYVAGSRGWLRMLITFTPEQGVVGLPADFLERWGRLGGSVDLDIPLNP